MSAYDTAKCPCCGSERYGVKDSRQSQVGPATIVKRRRVCSTCKHREMTWEISQELGQAALLDELMAELSDGS